MIKVGSEYIGERRFFFMITGVVVTAITLVIVAIYMYVSSGAIQVDLSRPDAEAAREKVASQATQQQSIEAFSADGPLDEKVLKDFLQLYDDAAYRATNTDLFSPASLDDESLQIDAPRQD